MEVIEDTNIGIFCTLRGYLHRAFIAIMSVFSIKLHTFALIDRRYNIKIENLSALLLSIQ